MAALHAELTRASLYAIATHLKNALEGVRITAVSKTSLQPHPPVASRTYLSVVVFVLFSITCCN